MTLHVLARGLLAGLILTLSTFPQSYACENCEKEMEENVREMERILRADTPELSPEKRNQLLALSMFQNERSEQNWEWEDWKALLELWERESNWREGALNPRSTARGIPQAMGSLNPETQSDEWLQNPFAQIEWGLNYIGKRYGSPSKALAHHDKKGWY
jgi:hypothetical protein